MNWTKFRESCEHLLVGRPDNAITYTATRFWFMRLLGFVYTFAFASLVIQVLPLLGERGLLPVFRYLPRLGADFSTLPTLFWFNHSDQVLLGAAWLGLCLAVVVMLGYASALIMFVLWALYLSFVYVGQVFYGYGWEMLLLETGFLAIFFGPSAPRTVIWLLRWLCFRLMLGAGLIKIRGDSCWHDLSCLNYHFETQPIPNPLSWFFHHLPSWVHRGGVLFNHIVELLAPALLLIPYRPCRLLAGSLFCLFQIILIFSGNLSFLNWLTIAIALSCFDDRFLPRIPRLKAYSSRPSWMTLLSLVILCAVVIWRSYEPVRNLIGPNQAMNRSYDRFYFLNTYGMFGSIGRERYEVVLEGSTDGNNWLAYEFPCKPGDRMRLPCVISPLQPRLDWQVWFAAMQNYQSNPWLVHMIYQLLKGDAPISKLLAHDPFAGKAPPRWIRAELYRYEFTDPGEAGWWKRHYVGAYLPPLELANPSLPQFLRAFALIDQN